MDILDHAVNKRIINGSFPIEKLYPTDIECKRDINFEAQAEMGLRQFSETPELFSILISIFREKVAEIDLLNDPNSYKHELNYLINAGCSGNFLRAGGSLNYAYNLVPVVTPLDKVLWYGAFIYRLEYDLGYDTQDETVNMMFTWIKLLNMAQEMELKTLRTVDVRKVTDSTNVFELIRGGFTNVKNNNCIRKLSNAEYENLRKLYKQKNTLLSQISEEKKEAEEFAEKTQEEWKLFLEIVNDISEKESNVIQCINKSVSGKDKIRAIHHYNNLVSKIGKFKYDLRGKEINLIYVFLGASDRLIKAPTYACACTADGEPFILSPAILTLARNPITYNYVLMTFHQFRLEPNKENAKRFVSIALSSIKRNLGGEEKDWVSLDEMIKDFYETVFEFMKENKSSIDKLSFNKLQQDSVFVEGYPTDFFLSSEPLRKMMASKIDDIKNSTLYEEELKRIVQGKPHTLEELTAQKDEIESEIEKIEREAIARKLVYSLNIIYIFCDALRIMVSNKRANIKIKRKDDVIQYRKELLNLDDKLVHKVYAHLGEHEIGMLEYREKIGIITSTLSEQEAQEEQYRNSVFADVFKDAVENLVIGIENEDTNYILKTKARIREEILRFPECDDKGWYSNWLDSISSRISSALVNNCKKRTSDYISIKEKIKISLGKQSEKLPMSALDSLTTAEMLYGQYASEEFAKKGFDFSCISALYYQAFEDAYNALIWQNYASMLNSLIINGQKYTDILEANRKSKITDPDAKGYLDNDSFTRGHYINYAKRFDPQTTTVKLSCMYKSFAILMENVCNPSDLNGFCDYFAKICGYTDRNKMFSDDEFMNRCQDFANAVSRSAVNRNNASHGGTFISIAQCRDDEKTVLNNLEAVRIDSIGLIQRLLYLLEKA